MVQVVWGRAKRGFAAQTPLKLAKREIFGEIGDISIPAKAKGHLRDGPKGGGLCAHSLPRKKDGGGHVCEQSKKIN